MKQTLLIVEDEPDIRDMLRFSLENAGFEVLEAETTKQSDLLIAKQVPDLILLDWMLPQVSGIKYAKQLKQQELTQAIPIIMLTAKAEEENKIKGLETGADDYITKPFSPKELIARIRAVLRRGTLISPDGIIKVGKLTINTDAHQVSVDDAIVDLSPIEYRLIHFFATHQERVFSREQLLNHVWGGEKYIDERTVDVQILRLRKSLTKAGCDPLIHTVHGVGYQFMEKAPK